MVKSDNQSWQDVFYQVRRDVDFSRIDLGERYLEPRLHGAVFKCFAQAVVAAARAPVVVRRGRTHAHSDPLRPQRDAAR